jgi:tetratricopeptide (TPR) repeat protein
VTSARTLAAAGLAVLLAAAAPAGADILQLKDGRFVEGVPMERTGDAVTLHYKNGDVLVPGALVADLFVEGAGGFEPKDEQEKALVEKGLVPHRGKWIPRAERDKAVAAEAAANRKRIEDAKAHRAWRNRYRSESKHFRWEYTVPPEVFAELRDLMEAYYETFMKKWKIKPDPKMGKPPICVYHDEEAYYQTSGAPRGAIGYFRFVKPIELDLYYDRLDPRLTIDVLFHEGNHLLTYMIDPTFMYPRWVDESLAEYYGASQWDAQTKTMRVGCCQEGRLVHIWDAIAANEWVGLEQLIRTESFDAIHYAWGWSLVHYLMETPKYSDKFQKFYLGLALDKKVPKRDDRPGFRSVPVNDQIEAFQRYLGVKDLKTLEAEWHAYIKESLKLESGRGYEEAGAWAWRFGMKLKAKRFLQKAVDAYTKNPNTYDTYAEVLLAQSPPQIEKAAEMWEKAIALDPLNALYRVNLGRALQVHGDEEQKEKGKKLVALALEMAPDDPGVWLQASIDEELAEKLGEDGAGGGMDDGAGGMDGEGPPPKEGGDSSE